MLNIIVFLVSAILTYFAVYVFGNIFIGIASAGIAIVSIYLFWKSFNYIHKDNVLVSKKLITNSTMVKISKLRQTMPTTEFTLSKMYKIESELVKRYEGEMTKIANMSDSVSFVEMLENADTRSSHEKFDALENIYHRVMQENTVNVLWAKTDSETNDMLVLFTNSVCITIEHDEEPIFGSKYYESMVLGCCFLKAQISAMEYIDKVLSSIESAGEA